MKYEANSSNHNAIVEMKQRNDQITQCKIYIMKIATAFEWHKVHVAECQRQCLPSHLHKVTLLT
ncbi:hypothetical protein T06_7873 [Trichinella sp. T6]|nr:hypothetical protein T06_7873 [Trichinella sp. T6]